MKSILIVLRGNINTDARVKKEINTLIHLGFKVTLAIWNWGDVFYKHEDIKIIDLRYGKQKSQLGKTFTFIKIIEFWWNVSKIINKGAYDYVHCNDLNTLGVLFFIRKHLRTSFIYDSHELFPEQFPMTSIRYRVWTWVERKLIFRAKAIIATEINRADYLKRKYGLFYAPYIVNNYPMYQSISPRDIKSELNLEKQNILICYSGIILRDRGLETIVRALKCLSEDYLLLIIGYAYDQKYLLELKEYIKLHGQEERIYYYGPVPSEDLLSVIAGCDICIALYEKNGLNNYYCSPNKVFDSIMAGVKVITNDYPSLQMLKNYKFVRLISKIEADQVANAAIELMKEKCEIGENTKRTLSWQSFDDIFSKIYN